MLLGDRFMLKLGHKTKKLPNSRKQYCYSIIRYKLSASLARTFSLTSNTS